MNFLDYCDAINAEIVLRRFPCQNNRWVASFQSCEVQENEAILKSEYGEAKNPQDALIDYAKKISGKRIIFNAMSKDYRREFTVPEAFNL